MEKSYFTKREREILKVRNEEPTHFGMVSNVQLSKPIVVVHNPWGDSFYSVKSVKAYVKHAPEFFSEVKFTEVRQMW